MFSNGNKLRSLRKARNKTFPSPHGDFVFELITNPSTSIAACFAVSVPSRGFCFRTFFPPNIYIESRHNVSVPSRGFCFRTQSIRRTNHGEDEIRFRPLTGILFSNLKTKWQKMQEAKGAFPSPHGDFVFELQKEFQQVNISIRGFPSPHGDFVFELFEDPDRFVHHSTCFRPLTGILFSNRKQKMVNVVRTSKSFRPLTGILFSNTSTSKAAVGKAAGVSVPSRGFCFRTKQAGKATTSKAAGKFPSPHGDFVFEQVRNL